MARLPVALRYALAVSVLVTATVAQGFAQNAQSDHPAMKDVRGAAQLVAFTGRIVVQRDTPWRLDVGDYVYPMEVIVTGSDGSGMFKVSDGSTFEVFENSKVVFRANNFNWEEMLELWLGKVKIQIEHPGGLPNHNKVRTPTAVISVRGTVFDVAYDADKEATTVDDEEGSVEVANALNLDNKRLLNANESIVVYKNSSLARRVDTGGILKRIMQTAMDALVQQQINQRSGTPSVAGGPAGTSTAPGSSTSAGDKNNSPAPPPPPPPPPPPAH